MVNEATTLGASKSAVARKYGATPSQVFNWCKQLKNASPYPAHTGVGDSIMPLAEYKSSLAKLMALEALWERVAGKISKEMEAGQMSAYNSSCSFSNLATAFCKIGALRLQIIDKVEALQVMEKSQGQGDGDDDEVDYAIQRESEKLCYELVKRKVERDRSEAAKKADASHS